MKTDDPYNLRPIWNRLLEIYNVYAAICKKNNLRHYITDGASLGARRHSGFIQWDDDLDISMPRPDYEKFLEIAGRELPSHLKLVYWKNTPELPVLFAKVQETREDVVAEVEQEVGWKLSNGLYLDILPIDGYPENRLYCKWIYFRDLLLIPLERFHIRKFGHLTRKGKIAWVCGMFMSIFVPWLWKSSQLLAIHDKTLKATPFEKSKMTGRCCQRPNLFRRKPVPREIWGEPVEREFDVQTACFPQNLDAHLKNEYGPTYMTPPPEANRRPCHTFRWRYPWWLGPTAE